MKKAICILTTLLILVSALTSCTFTQRTSGALAGNERSSEEVKKILSALAENQNENAKALLHPQIADDSQTSVLQLSRYIDGRDAEDLEVINVSVQKSTGVFGTSTQEQVTYKATLSDGEVIYINANYLSDRDGEGFITFQLVLGIV